MEIFSRYPLFLIFLNSNSPFSSEEVKLIRVESFELSSITAADGIDIPAESEIRPLIVALAGACARRLKELNNNKLRIKRCFLIIIQMWCSNDLVNFYLNKFIFKRTRLL